MGKNTIQMANKESGCIAKIKSELSWLMSCLRADALKVIVVLGTMAVFALAVAVPFTEWRGRSMLFVLMPLTSLAFGAVLAVRKKLINDVGSILLAAYALWLTVTRVILGDYFLKESFVKVGVVLFASVLCYNIPFIFNTNQGRNKLLRVAADISVAASALISIIALLEVVLKVHVAIGGVYNIGDGFYIDTRRLYCFSEDPNLVAQVLLLGLCMAMLRIIQLKGRPLMWLYAACVVLILACMLMADSRTCNLLFCAIAAVGAGLIYFSGLRDRAESTKGQRAAKIAVGIACCVAVFFVFYFCVSGLRTLVQNVGESMRVSEQDMVSVTDVLSEEAVDGDAEEEFILSDRPITSEEIFSLNDRTNIYRCAFEELRKNPRVMLLGEIFSSDWIYYESENLGSMSFAHWHNTYLEVIFETGLVGLLLVAAFVIFMLLKMVRIFFGSFDRYSAADKFLLAVPASGMLLSILEPLLFAIEVNSFVLPTVYFLSFVLVCGFVAASDRKEASEARKDC